MEILASCSLEESQSFNGKLSVAGTSDKVSLNVLVTDESESDVFDRVGSNVKFITFVGKKATYCPTGLEGRVFNQYSFQDLENGSISPSMGVTDLVALDSDFCNMKVLSEYCEKYPSVRFIGGNLLQVDGVRIGRVSEGREKLPIVLDGVYDSFVEVNLNDLEGVSEKVSKAKRGLEISSEGKKRGGSKGGSKTSKEPKEKKVSKRAQSLAMFLNNDEEEAF